MFNIDINIEDMFEMHEVIIEGYIEDKLTNRQQMHAPKEMLIANFINTAKQMKYDQRPIKLKMIRQESIWDEFEQRRKTLNNEIELSNDAMIAWEENKKGGDNNE
jgi:hypothetical protein